MGGHREDLWEAQPHAGVLRHTLKACNREYQAASVRVLPIICFILAKYKPTNTHPDIAREARLAALAGTRSVA